MSLRRTGGPRTVMGRMPPTDMKRELPCEDEDIGGQCQMETSGQVQMRTAVFPGWGLHVTYSTGIVCMMVLACTNAAYLMSCGACLSQRKTRMTAHLKKPTQE